MVISVSMPSFSLADIILPQALMAWDPRLLSPNKHLVLVISGIRKVYPVLLRDGALSPVAVNLNTKLSFRIGLTSSYKPDKEFVGQLSRSFSLQEQKDPVYESLKDHIQPEDPWDEADDERYDAMVPQPMDAEQNEEEENPVESFVFGLSSSLEALLNDRFLALLQIRLKYGIGWAGAEALLSRAHRSQRKVEDVIAECLIVRTLKPYSEYRYRLMVSHTQDLQRADIAEGVLATSNRLPQDFLAFAGSDDKLNLPLLAFSYLLRRLVVCRRIICGIHCTDLIVSPRFAAVFALLPHLLRQIGNRFPSTQAICLR